MKFYKTGQKRVTF